jgi:nucleotide-binding universal stress UspA family protein
MFTNLLVPLDDSAGAATALSAARTLATALDAQIRLLWVVRRPTGTLDGHADDLHEATEYLDGQARKLRTAVFRAESCVRSGEVAEAILAEIGERDIDLVVMATRGRGGVMRAVLGSVTSEVVSRSPVPVVLLRENSRPLKQIKNILVPVDGSTAGASALGATMQLAGATGARVTILQVVPATPLWTYGSSAAFDFEYINPGWDKAAVASAQQHMDEHVERMRAHGVSVRGVAVLGDVSATIAQTAAEISADLIMMSARARTGPARAILGSVADAVVRHAPSPVLLLPHGRASAASSLVLASERFALSVATRETGLDGAWRDFARAFHARYRRRKCVAGGGVVLADSRLRRTFAECSAGGG